MLRAGALSYALIFIILTGAFCLGLIWILSGNRFIQSTIQSKEKALLNVYAASHYLTHIDYSDRGDEFDLFFNGDTVTVSLKKWGNNTVAKIHSFKNNYSIKRTLLIGDYEEEAYPALYLADTDLELKVSGNTNLKGKLILPKRGIKRAFIEGKNFSRDNLYEGKIGESERKLPELNPKYVDYSLKELMPEDRNYLVTLPNDSLFSFHNPTAYYYSENPIFIQEHKLKGNLIIESSDSIVVDSNTELNNVILIAPVVQISSGFQGKLQVYSKERIEIEDDVTLHYPSFLSLLDDDELFRRAVSPAIKIGKNVLVSGEIILVSTSPDFRNPVQLLIQEESRIIGTVYNVGDTQLKGSINGSLFTKRFFLKTKSSTYTNHLLDAEIDNSILPDYYINSAILKGDQLKSTILEWLE